MPPLIPGRSPASRKILILAANPTDSARLRLDKEIKEIEAALERSKQRDSFALTPKGAVTARDFIRAVSELEPQIVHFCGHADETSIGLEDERGRTQAVSPAALAALFKTCESVECVVLTACSSAPHAAAIAQHIPYAIGMSQPILDKDAIAFSASFYDALGAGKSIEQAFDLGQIALQMLAPGEDLASARKLVAVPEDDSLTPSAQVAAYQIPQLAIGKPAARVQKPQPRLLNPVLTRKRLIGGAIGLVALLVGIRLSLPPLANHFTQSGIKDYEAGQLASARSNYQLALRLNPENIQTRYLLGVLYEELQQPDAAIAQYQQAIVSNLSVTPASPERLTLIRSHNNLGRLMLLKADYQQAWTWLERGLSLVDADAERSNPDIRYEHYNLLKNLGWGRLKQQNYTEAADWLGQAIELNYKGAAAHCLLAQVLEAEKRSAVAEWETCIQYARSNNPDEAQWIGIAQEHLKTVEETPQ